jgi:hypothetical protein
MGLYADAIGLTRLPDFVWEPYVSLTTPPSAPSASPRPAAVEKREAKRQQTLAERKAVAASPAAAPTVQRGPQTRLGLGRSLLSWSPCPVPLTAVVNRERDEHGQTQVWVLVSTSNDFTAAHIRSTYELRSAIEERHRQYKCFWDLTSMHSCAFSLVVNQALFVLLAYTLAQAHLVLRQRQELTRSVWERTWQLLSPTLEVVAVYYRQRFCLLARGIRQNPTRHCRTSSGQVAGATQKHRTRTILSAGKHTCSIIRRRAAIHPLPTTHPSLRCSGIPFPDGFPRSANLGGRQCSPLHQMCSRPA